MNDIAHAESERLISEKVEFGLYSTASEVVRAGLRRLFAQDEPRAKNGLHAFAPTSKIGLGRAGSR